MYSPHPAGYFFYDFLVSIVRWEGAVSICAPHCWYCCALPSPYPRLLLCYVLVVRCPLPLYELGVFAMVLLTTLPAYLRKL